MKIDSLQINHFGKLEEKEITFGPHINVIYGENESGKSTLLKFITGMFYGLSKNKNGKKISDLEKYTPWKEGEFSGKLTYHLDDGTQYEVFRNFTKKNPTIYDKNLVDISKEFPIDKTKGNLFFIQQTGMDEELFCSTIVSEQAGVKLEEKEKQSIMQKITNLMGTGRDDTSFDKVIAKLNKRQLEEIGTEKSQERPINITKKKIHELEKSIEILEHYQDTRQEMQERKEDLTQEIQEKQDKVNALKEIKKRQEEQSLEKEKIKVKEEDRKEYNEKLEQLKIRKQEISEQDIKTEKQPSYLLSIIGIMLTIILAVVAIGLKNPIIGAVTAFILLFSILSYVLIKQNNTKMKQTEKQAKEREVKRLDEQIEMLQGNIEEKKQVIKSLTEQIQRQQEVENLRIKNKYIHQLKDIEELLQKENIAYELESIQTKVNSKRLELKELELEEKTVLPELETLASKKEELEQEKETYQYLQAYTESIQLAKQTIEEAYACMKQEITPKFTQNLSDHMKEFSKGKYSKVMLNDQNEIMVEMENGNYVSAENLSIGTMDQIYLSLRLAMVEGLEKETMPILLDETFAYFDEKRLEHVLTFLEDGFQDRQIVIFTCTKREQEILEKNKIAYHKMEL